MVVNPVRAAKALYSVFALVKNPDRLGEVFEMADALSTPKTMEPIIDRLERAYPDATLAIAERHRIRVDLAELRRRPEGTLGRVFADHMIDNGLDPAALPALEVSDRISFFRAHLYETHDIWHVVTGFGTDWKGELGLQAFYLAQIPGPLPAALLAVGCLRVAGFDEDGLAHALFDEIVRGWTMGKTATPLFGVHWDELWDLPLAEVRARFGIDPAPSVKLSNAA